MTAMTMLRTPSSNRPPERPWCWAARKAATSAKMPSTRAYAPNSRITTSAAIPGLINAISANRIATTPRSASAHQLPIRIVAISVLPAPPLLMIAYRRARRNRLSAWPPKNNEVAGGGDQRSDGGMGRRDRGRGGTHRDAVRRRQHGVAHLGERPAAYLAAWRLRLVDALGAQRAAAVAPFHCHRPGSSRSRRIGDAARAVDRRGLGGDRRRRTGHRAAKGWRAASRRVFLRRGDRRHCRSPARR